MNQAQITFLTALHNDALAACDGRIVIFTLPERQIQLFSNIRDCVSAVSTLPEQSNIYVGVCLVRPDIQRGRGTVADVVAMPGLWADIDFADPAHNKPNLPPDEATAMRVIDAIGAPPTIIIHSGHGLQAYWLFREPLIITDDAERSAAVRLSQRWGGAVQRAARQVGYTVDSVCDLTRVMRLPGTRNHKRTPPVDVVILQHNDDRRYNPDDLEIYMPEQSDSDATSTEPSPIPLILISSAEPPASKLDALLENDRRFRATWVRKRPDLPDQSQSAYDMSLAVQALQAGWTEQEAANLIIAHRRKHGQNTEKALREDYMQRTIGKARAAIMRDEALTNFIRRAESSHITDAPPLKAMPHESQKPDLSQAEIDSIYRDLSAFFRQHVVGFHQYGHDEPIYSILFEPHDGAHPVEITIGDSRAVLSFARWQSVMFQRGVVIDLPAKHGRQVWAGILQSLAHIVSVIDLPESDISGEWMEHIAAYLSTVYIYRSDTWETAVAERSPFIRDNQIYLNASALTTWLTHQRRIRGSVRATCIALRRVGFERQVVKANTIQARYWFCDIAALPALADLAAENTPKDGTGDTVQAPYI